MQVLISRFLSSRELRFPQHISGALYYALIEPVGTLLTEVELRYKTAVLDTARNISLPFSYETSYWLSGMTKDDRDA